SLWLRWTKQRPLVASILQGAVATCSDEQHGGQQCQHDGSQSSRCDEPGASPYPNGKGVGTTSQGKGNREQDDKHRCSATTPHRVGEHGEDASWRLPTYCGKQDGQ